MDFQAIRKEYEDQGIDIHELHESPFVQLETWLEEASSRSPGRWFETNAMALATTDSDGNVSVRMVLLKGIETRGIRFFTNYGSRKGNQLAINPKAAVVFHWPYMGRQIRIEGSVDKTSRAISEQYFHSRPRDSQLSAAISSQSETIESREELEARFTILERKLDGQDVPLPTQWGGYMLYPTEFEFWQGRSNRLHDRISYRLQNDQPSKWAKARLAP